MLRIRTLYDDVILFRVYLSQLVEEQVQEERRTEAEDHQAQVEALEKQLKSNKHFLDVSKTCLFSLLSLDNAQQCNSTKTMRTFLMHSMLRTPVSNRLSYYC